MARFHLEPLSPSISAAEISKPFEPRIRSGLLLAFPLPARNGATDENFRRPLEARADRTQAATQAPLHWDRSPAFLESASKDTVGQPWQRQSEPVLNP